MDSLTILWVLWLPEEGITVRGSQSHNWIAIKKRTKVYSKKRSRDPHNLIPQDLKRNEYSPLVPRNQRRAEIQAIIGGVGV